MGTSHHGIISQALNSKPSRPVGSAHSRMRAVGAWNNTDLLGYAIHVPVLASTEWHPIGLNLPGIASDHRRSSIGSFRHGEVPFSSRHSEVLGHQIGPGYGHPNSPVIRAGKNPKLPSMIRIRSSTEMSPLPCPAGKRGFFRRRYSRPLKRNLVFLGRQRMRDDGRPGRSDRLRSS